jgi:hypothetical protein
MKRFLFRAYLIRKVEVRYVRRLQFVLGCILAAFLVWVIPASAAPAPVTYLNANFGPNFYRSSGTIQLQSATATAYAQAKNSEVDFSASANNDPNETSSGFSSYNIGTVNAGTGSLNGVSVSPRTLSLSGSAHFGMNLWFDSNDDGEYFVWNHNQFAGLGGDVYALGPSGTGPLTIDNNTLLYLIPYCFPGENDATLTIINAGGCTTILPNTNVARWVGIDIAGGTKGSGSARL